MSYEGYSQFLCKKGHYWEMDCYYADYEEHICPKCKGKAVWENMVDTTNDAGNPVELKVAKEEYCECCGQLTEKTFHMPKRGKI
jgi:hypothetical protein